MRAFVLLAILMLVLFKLPNFLLERFSSGLRRTSDSANSGFNVLGYNQVEFKSKLYTQAICTNIMIMLSVLALS